MIGRWAVRLQEYEFDIVHRKTERHENGDGLTRLHRPSKVPRCEEITPWKEPEPPKGPGYGQWTWDSEHNAVSEDVELLIIQAWRTAVEGDLLGFIFGTVEAGHRQPIIGEFLILLTQLLDTLPIDIISHCDESRAPHILSRSLMSYLQWSACLEGNWDNHNYLSHDNYMNPVEIIDILFFYRGEPTSEDEEEEDEEEEDESEDTPEEDKYYSEHSKHESGAIRKEEEEKEAEGAGEGEEAGQAETQKEDLAEEDRRRAEIEEGKRSLEQSVGTDLPIPDDPTRDPEPPAEEDEYRAAETSSSVGEARLTSTRAGRWRWRADRRSAVKVG
ncbi:hypothetical protein CBR_g39831 [Chara braunii]|uniref:Uncharacterized protein n=1 Tax=Chara braunii TaxID=69332 RepID=A0A388LSQ8_CHABU|nr:hypothetical protein CBR_g39831 [Chara braunii]|eukprot:GBG85263.1 hypothetical protein CBR_g39831 [Chara braunii]